MDLKAAGLNFETCEIDLLEEPVETPTMAYFESHGFRYTTFRIDPDGDVSQESYNTTAPFPTLTRETIERFIAGEPWQALTQQLAMIEVPVGSYGNLRLTATDRESFTEDETAALEEFAAAVSLGYAN